MAVGKISRGLKRMAGDLQCPVITMSQLNRDADRAIETDPESIPQLYQLRESGSIEQDANMVMMLSRPGARNDGIHDPTEAHLYVLKNRSGQAGAHIALQYAPATTKFYNDGTMPNRFKEGRWNA